MDEVDRRYFLTGLVAASGAALSNSGTVEARQDAESSSMLEWIPRQDPAVVQETVGVSHSNLARVRELVERQPALANATVDWGFGDWETALGAASHVGRREIAELLLAHGARPSIFSAAMLGQLDVVKAFVAASPGVQRTHGPHGIPLMAHARAGGAGAAEVVKYLESLGDADRRAPSQPVETTDLNGLVGEYVFGPGPRDHFVVDVQKDQLGLARATESRRFLFHHGDLVFYPAGVPSVRIAFARDRGRATQLTIANPEVFLTARRRT